jgi:NADH dehydrogenase
MRRFLITGGTGTIGSALVKNLIARGHAVRVLTLPNDPNASHSDGNGVEIVYGDISNPEEVNGICDGIDTVIHLAAVILSRDEDVFDRVNVTGTRYLLLDARNTGVSHFIYISSASVNYRKMTPYSRSKRIAERYVKESAVPWTIIRPTLVYGPTGGMEFDIFLEKLMAYPIVPVIGKGKALKRPVYIDDLVDGIIKAAAFEHGAGKIYNLSGGSAISMFEMTRLCLTLLGREDKIIVRIPFMACWLLAQLMEKFLKNPPLSWNMIAGATQRADIDPYDAIIELGYNPIPFEKKIGDCFPRQK